MHHQFQHNKSLRMIQGLRPQPTTTATLTQTQPPAQTYQPQKKVNHVGGTRDHNRTKERLNDDTRPHPQYETDHN